LQFVEKWGLAKTFENCSTDNFYKILLLYSRNSAIIFFEDVAVFLYKIVKKNSFFRRSEL